MSNGMAIDVYPIKSTIDIALQKIQKTGCGELAVTENNKKDIINYIEDIYYNYVSYINETLKRDSIPLQYLWNLKKHDVEKVEKSDISQIKRIIKDLYIAEDYDECVNDNIKDKIEFYIQNVKSEQNRIQKYFTSYQYTKNQDDNLPVKGNILRMIIYHIKSIDTLIEMIKSRISQYKKGVSNDWSHWWSCCKINLWFFSITGSNWHLSESANLLETYVLPMVKQFYNMPEILKHNINLIPRKLFIVNRNYKDYYDIKLEKDKILKKIIGENMIIDNPKIQEIIKENTKKYNCRLKIMNGEFRSSVIELYNCLDINTSETRNQERDMVEYYDNDSDSDSE